MAQIVWSPRDMWSPCCGAQTPHYEYVMRTGGQWGWKSRAEQSLSPSWSSYKSSLGTAAHKISQNSPAQPGLFRTFLSPFLSTWSRTSAMADPKNTFMQILYAGSQLWLKIQVLCTQMHVSHCFNRHALPLLGVMLFRARPQAFVSSNGKEQILIHFMKHIC